MIFLAMLIANVFYLVFLYFPGKFHNTVPWVTLGFAWLGAGFVLACGIVALIFGTISQAELDRRKGLILLVACYFAGFGYAVTVCTNVIFDRSHAYYEDLIIEGKSYSHGRHPTPFIYTTLSSPWAGIDASIQTDWRTFDRLTIGEHVRVGIKQGWLGISYVSSIEPYPPKDLSK